MRVKHMKALDLKFFALKKTVLAMDFIWMIMCIDWIFKLKRINIMKIYEVIVKICY